MKLALQIFAISTAAISVCLAVWSLHLSRKSQNLLSQIKWPNQGE